MGVAGHSTVSTPTIDQLARNGVRFSTAYSSTPTCSPARRALMTGTTARAHGDRVFSEWLKMPNLPTLAQTLSEAGYQTYAVGKLHVYPQRDRIGFHDALINEEGRHHLGLKADDFELFLAEQGFPGQEHTHGVAENEYMARPWHLPEYCHPTNWTVREMCKAIKRRDPTRPAFWFMSFNHPHPPLAPLGVYLDMYRDVDIEMPVCGDWAEGGATLPYALRIRRDLFFLERGADIRRARQAFYALCTHIDHQIRLVIGMLREEDLLSNTIIVFTSDHGDMLGDFDLYQKGVFYDGAARIPLIVVPTAEYRHMGHHVVDERLVELRDVMPTLLDLAGVPIPESVEGVSLATDASRQYLCGEHYEDERASRMIRDDRYKLIYYPVGNRVQLFDINDDPRELKDLSAEPSVREVRERLTRKLMEHLYGSDLEWIEKEKLKGQPDKEFTPQPHRDLNDQRGWRFMLTAR